MKSIFWLVPFLICVYAGFSQKPVIDTSILDKWPSVGGMADTKISEDGKYLMYGINQPALGKYGMLVRSTAGSWQREFESQGSVEMTRDSKWLIFQAKGDSLCMLRLGSQDLRWVPGVRAYKLLRLENKEWLAYQPVDSNRKDTWVFRDYRSGRERTMRVPADYRVCEKYNALFYVRQVAHGADSGQMLLEWMDMHQGKEKVIWQGKKIWGFNLDAARGQVVFASQDRLEDAGSCRLWHYRLGMERPVEIFNRKYLGMDTNLVINLRQRIEFNQKGNRIFFELIGPAHPHIKGKGIQVDVWSYKDDRLQEEQLREEQYGLRARVKKIMAINLEDGKVVEVQEGDEHLYISEELGKLGDFITLIKGGFRGDFWLEARDLPSVYLLDLKNGNKTLLKEKVPYDQKSSVLKFQISPKQKYIIHYDPVQNDYFLYEISSKTSRNIKVPTGSLSLNDSVGGRTRNITKGIPVSWEQEMNNAVPLPGRALPHGIAGWRENDRAVLLYDAYDIWEMDLKGTQPPKNLTHGYGRAHHIQFRLAQEDFQPILQDRESILLTTFDSTTKYSGFYRQLLDSKDEPVMLSMGPFKYSSPQKAAQGDTWVLVRESAVDAPNFFATNDFKNFRTMSTLHSQAAYNWLRAELVSWRMTDGQYSQGILYKPEDFDSTHRYPVLINYYEKHSDELYEFKWPALSRDNINIPYFVSRGYLVFIPDIHYADGVIPGDAAVNAVVSGAHYLSRYPWVDSTRMGIQGHSFGGGETNYLVTHSHFFAAAAEAAGPSDAISAYGTLNEGMFGRQFFFETSQERIRATPWERPDLYIRASPVLDANNATTPLLMRHNKEDGLVPWDQAVEFFTALRRLGKKAWLLQYDGAGHSLGGGSPEAMDYTLRLEQFFDHYLKGTAPPKWMTEGIPASQKGIDAGYELDTSGRQP